MGFKTTFRIKNYRKITIIKISQSKMNQFLNIIIMNKEIGIRKSKITIITKITKIINISLFYHQKYIQEINLINKNNSK